MSSKLRERKRRRRCWPAGRREGGQRRGHVLAAIRKLRAELPVSIAAPNFRDCTYVVEDASDATAIERRRVDPERVGDLVLIQGDTVSRHLTDQISPRAIG